MSTGLAHQGAGRTARWVTEGLKGAVSSLATQRPTKHETLDALSLKLAEGNVALLPLRKNGALCSWSELFCWCTP